ncbi:MAG: M35 family metallo-endopeptidase [Luteibacter sp.]|uniref:M35 family metallo-endopeptidase n=1 Tax=Luteibacter sp. TaxID=1886636 RepID=UPI0028096339|nr:M35 family metallo-endopeptidase [Luteibacter sp.]MDQ7994599.1 M35 family metallo-endopeptidase [Luteibacter sp.]
MKQLIVGAGLMLAALSAEAEGHLKAVLQQADSGHPTKLTLTLTNDGDGPVSFEKQNTPIDLLDGVHTANDQFDVEAMGTAEPAPARFQGYFVHYSGHPVENFITLQPGQMKVATYDLVPDYDLSPKTTYQVTFRMRVGQGPVDDQDNVIPNDLHLPVEQAVVSNTLLVTTPDEKAMHTAMARIQASPADFPPVTDPKRLGQLSDAVSYGRSWMANPAWVNYEEGLPPHGKDTAVSIHSAAYKQWFGTYNNNDHYDKVITGTLHAIADRLDQSPEGTALHKITFIDGCSSSTGATAVAVAHTGSVKASGVYEIAICERFWKLDPKPTKGKVGDSMAGTMVHEVSHFFDLPTDPLGWSNPTYDWAGYAYSRSACHKLVTDSRAKAVASASNFEYFIEDVQEFF